MLAIGSSFTRGSQYKITRINFGCGLFVFISRIISYVQYSSEREISVLSFLTTIVENHSYVLLRITKFKIVSLMTELHLLVFRTSLSLKSNW